MSEVFVRRYSRWRVIGVACGIGAQDAGCEDGPVAFHRSQAWQHIEHHPWLDWGKTLFVSENESHSRAVRIAELIDAFLPEVIGSKEEHGGKH